MEPNDYQHAINFFQNRGPLRIDTLGRRSTIIVDVMDTELRITNSRNRTMIIDLHHWNRVVDRVNMLNIQEREMTSRYEHGDHGYNWNEAPHWIFSPYVPAIMRYIQENQQN